MTKDALNPAGTHDPERWWKTAGHNARLIGRECASPIVLKGSDEDRWWLFGWHSADQMLKIEQIVAEYRTREAGS